MRQARGRATIICGGLLLAMAMALPVSAVAKPRFSVQRPQRWSEFSLPATNGYRVTVGATKAIRKVPASVYVTASKGKRYRVDYLARGRSTKDGGIEAKLPGVGRVAVRFQPAKVIRGGTIAENCKGTRSVIRKGVFRGTIELRGELGYTILHATSARGKVTQSFRQVCDERESGTKEGAPAPTFHERSLYTGTKEGAPAISFSAYVTEFGLKSGGPHVNFIAYSSNRRDGLFVSSSVTVEGDAAEFATEPGGGLENASVTAPPPFQGSASFHLDSPTSSSWTGALSVELPGIGWVALAGPGFWSALCGEETCTKTLPPNVRILSS